MLTTDQLTKRNEIEERVRSESPSQFKKYWSKLDNEGKEELIQRQTDYLFAGITEFREALKQNSLIYDQMIVFFVGLFIGIVGGLLSNIVHDFLRQFGIFYVIGAIILFFLLLLFIVAIHIEMASYPLNSTKMLRSFQKKAIKELKKRKNQTS